MPSIATSSAPRWSSTFASSRLKKTLSDSAAFRLLLNIEAPMIFLIAIFVPPISLVIRDAKYDAIASLVMICLSILLAPALLPYIWVAAIVHSFHAIRRQDDDRRTQEIIAAIKGRPT